MTASIRVVAVASAVALIGLSIGWELVWARTGHGTLVLKAVPLVLALPGLLKHRMYTYRWLSLALWLYVAEGLVRITDRPPANWCAGAEVALAIVLFVACAAQVRWRHRWRGGCRRPTIRAPTRASRTEMASLLEDLRAIVGEHHVVAGQDDELLD